MPSLSVISPCQTRCPPISASFGYAFENSRAAPVRLGAVHLPLRRYVPAASDDAVDAVEGALVPVSRTQPEARHVTGGCGKAQRATQRRFRRASRSRIPHAPVRNLEVGTEAETEKAAKHLAKVVNPLSFLLHPWGYRRRTPSF